MGSRKIKTAQGTTLLEVLITIVILTFGLLALAKLQGRLQLSEMEAYQRAQALILLNDMASRIANNRHQASNYVTGTNNPLGTGMTCPTTVATRQQSDFNEWCNALQGAGEMSGSSKLGAMIGARGCIESLGSSEYLITVTWQGLAPISAPPSSVACAKDLYDGGTGTACVNDLCRRAVTTIVRIATL